MVLFMKKLITPFIALYCGLFITSVNAVQWQAQFEAPIAKFMTVGLAGPFPMIYVFDENDKVIFYGKGIKSAAHQTLMTLDINAQQPIVDDTTSVAAYLLPSIYNKNAANKPSGKKLVVVSLDEASFKNEEQDKCVPCRTVFAAIDANSSKLAGMEKILINMTNKNQ